MNDRQKNKQCESYRPQPSLAEVNRLILPCFSFSASTLQQAALPCTYQSYMNLVYQDWYYLLSFLLLLVCELLKYFPIVASVAQANGMKSGVKRAVSNIRFIPLAMAFPTHSFKIHPPKCNDWTEYQKPNQSNNRTADSKQCKSVVISHVVNLTFLNLSVIYCTSFFSMVTFQFPNEPCIISDPIRKSSLIVSPTETLS